MVPLPIRAPLTISVVVCAYTEARWDELICSLESLAAQTRCAHEVILVIDHNPALFARCRQSFADIAVVENSNGRGLSGARNTGVASSTGDVVAFIDEDAMAAPDWLEVLASLYDEGTEGHEGDTAGRGPRVLGAGGSISPQWVAAKPAWFPDEFLWVVGCTYRGLPEVTTPIRNLIGCNMSIRRSVLDEVGGFRIGRIGALSIGQENDETEICVRMHERYPDGVILYDPLARVINHRVPASRTAASYFARRCLSEGISKSRLSKVVGNAAGLSSERTYVSKTLPLGAARGVTEALRGRPAAILQSIAIVVGLTITAGGFVYGRLRMLIGLDRQPASLT
ncbi:MAG: glycosyltransferase family 2 protein [Ilumatobacteraceae bacterium]